MRDLQSKYISIHFERNGNLSVHNFACEDFFKLSSNVQSKVKSNVYLRVRGDYSSSWFKLSSYSIRNSLLIPLELNRNISIVHKFYSIMVSCSYWFIYSCIKSPKVQTRSVDWYLWILNICSKTNTLWFSILNKYFKYVWYNFFLKTF